MGLGEPQRIDLSKLGETQLRALGAAVERELARRAQQRRDAERARGGLHEAPQPAYRNPSNPAETWSGRGPQPVWVAELRARGVRLDTLRVGPGDDAKARPR